MKEIAIISQEIIKKNKVYKCIEYDFTDSLTFFKNNKNGLYTIFDTRGRRIEENTYSSGIVDEIKVIYTYDKSGRCHMMHWYEENSLPKISRTRITKYDSIGRIIESCEFSPNSNERCYKNFDIANVTDSSQIDFKSSRLKVFFTFSDLSKKDTIYKKYNFYEKERLDSNVIIFFNKGKQIEKLTTRFFYLNGILSRSEFVKNDGSKIMETNTTYYLKTGLLDRIETIRYYFALKKSSPRIDKDFRKFVYSYWK